MAVPSISVVIPTRNRPAMLQHTLESLAAARGAGALEVLVVDDASDEPLAGQLDLGRLPDGFRVHRRAEMGGVNGGRTTGIQQTGGEVVAFLDDDVTVDAGWVEGVQAAFADGELAVMGGRLHPATSRPLPSWIRGAKLGYISCLDLGDQPCAFPDWATPIGANFAVRRRWLERVGGFRDGLDRIGASLLSGGDTDLVARIERAGGAVRYWPAATVAHHVADERLSRAWFRRRAEAQGVTDILMRHRGPLPPAALAREVVRPARAGGILLKRLAARRDPFDAELWLWSTRGRWRAARDLARGAG